MNKDKVLFPKCARFAYAEYYKKYNHEQGMNEFGIFSQVAYSTVRRIYKEMRFWIERKYFGQNLL